MKTVLLAGGTSETGAIAAGLAAAGWDVVVSTATDLPLDVSHGATAIRRRCGRLDAAGFAALIRAEKAAAVVSAGHPYAAELRTAVRRAAAEAGVPLVEFLRPPAGAPPEGVTVRRAADHAEAARLAVQAGRSLLLTIGVTHLVPYVAAARAARATICARVLPGVPSRAAARAAGLGETEIVAGRGAVSAAENEALIRRLGADVLVTKDSGEAGGLRAKYEAARRTGCTVILVERPADAVPVDAARSVAEVVANVQRLTFNAQRSTRTGA